ncbi:MAG: class I SAM-dependent methyltransferase [Gemmatimonadota bacterium]|nr:class I SAM-dependent methyltransferase [Gemmatimonadota bacterium]
MALVDFVCPRCHRELDASEHEFRCASCSAVYPIIFGIPDFRVEPDPWISFEDDRAKAKRLLEITEGSELAESVEAYWQMTPGTPPEYARRFTEYVLGGERRSAEWLDSIGPAPEQQGAWLEIGSASGDLIATCAARGIEAVGVDVAMRWLVLARKRASLRQARYTLVCANGEHLPFRNGAFARVVSVGTLEHCRRAEEVLAEGARVLRGDGDVVVRTTNRFSLLPEPHVNLWGVGLLPRSWADRYVRLRGGQGYLHHRILSAGELARGMREAGFEAVRVRPAPLLPSDHARLGAAGRMMSPVYSWARSLPVLPAIMRWVAPLLEARGRRP